MSPRPSPAVIDLSDYVTDDTFNEYVQEFEQTKAEVGVQLERLDAMTADGVLDRAEKKYWVQQHAIETADYNKLIADAATWDVSALAQTYTLRFNDLNSYLTNLSPAWDDGAQDTPIDRVSFRAAWQTVYAAKIALTQAMAEAAKWDKVVGPGKPEDNATVGAPNNTPVGDKTANEVVDAITNADGEIIKSEQLKADVEAAKQLADELKQTYGSTVAAAASADAAAQHEANAKTAEDNAKQAKADAQAAYDAADAARDEAVQKAYEAGLSETAASGKADIAQGFAQGASDAAGAASISASSAAGKADEASRSASAAQTSSVSASTALDGATTVVGKLFPAFDAKETFWVPQPAASSYWESGAFGHGVAFRPGVGSQCSVRAKGAISAVVGKRYRVMCWMNQWQAPGGADGLQQIYWEGGKEDGSPAVYMGGGPITAVPGVLPHGTRVPASAVGSWVQIGSEIQITSAHIDQGIRTLRPIVIVNEIATQAAYAFHGWSFEDITSESKSLGYANAASQSASSASASADTAGQKASAASGSAQQASTSAGEAKGYRDTAVSSASGASGSATTATEQAGLAASAASGVDTVFANTFPNFVGPVGKKAYAYAGDNATGFDWQYGPNAGWPQPYVTAQNAGQGGNYNRITFKESIEKVVGRRYRLTGWFYNHGTNCQSVKLWILNTDNNIWDNNAVGRGGDAVAPDCVNDIALNQGGFWKVGVELTVASDWKSKWKPIFEFRTTGAAPNGLWHMTGITVEDITSENASKGFANAASGSASTAQAKADEAGRSASAAQTSSVSAGSAALDALSRSTGNVVGRSSFDATSGKGQWSGAGTVMLDNAIGAYILQQTNRDLTEGDLRTGNWRNRRFRISGNVAAFNAFPAKAGLMATHDDNTTGYYIQTVCPNYSGYRDFSVDIALPSNVKAARPILVSDGTWDAAGHGVNWREIRIQDITSEYSAAASAQAASDSYSNAQYQAGLAGQSASAASGHANSAQQHSANAQGAASAASGSAAQASGSASAAASSATLAATYSTAGGNLISNTDFAVDLSGWSFTQYGTTHSGSRNLLGDGYRPKNENTICLYQSNNNPSDYGFWQADRIPVDPSKLYEFSVGGANSRCSLTIYLRFRYGDGSISRDFTATRDAFSEGNTLANFPTMWVRGQPPAGTQWVECLILKNGTRAGYNDSYAWFVRPQLREVYASAPAPATYAPGRPGAALATMSASITQNGTAIATANSSLASLQTIVQSGNPNLLRNGGFAQGMNYWAQTAAGWGTFQSPWGKIATRGDWSGEYSYIESERAPVYGGQLYTLSADSMYYLNSGSGHCYTELVWYDAAGNYISQNSGTAHAATHDYSNTSSNRNIHRLSVQAPGNAAFVASRLVHYKVNGSTASNAGWRQVKLEQGNVMTAFSNEASVTTISETLTNVDGKANTALARAAVRLDVNGYVVGWEANNNGSYGNMVINTNNFAIKNPNGGARTEYENGCWKVFDANGQLRVRLGNLSA